MVNEVEKDNVIDMMSEIYNFWRIAYYVYNPTPTEIALIHPTQLQ